MFENLVREKVFVPMRSYVRGEYKTESRPLVSDKGRFVLIRQRNQDGNDGLGK